MADRSSLGLVRPSCASPLAIRGEDEGEGFGYQKFWIETLILPFSLAKGEATHM